MDKQIHFAAYEDGTLRIYENGKLIAVLSRDLLPSLMLEAAKILQETAP